MPQPMAHDLPGRRYEALDGLRGFAAFSVLLVHLGHWLDCPPLASNSFLAVDLFFCLSGYVLPLAYRRKVTSLSTAGFLRTRLIRLMPLIVLAMAITVPYVVLRSRLTDGGVPNAALATAVLLGLLNLPFFGAPPAMGGPAIFPLNGPQFTLFLEMVANVGWWASRRINQVRMACGLALGCFLMLPFVGLGGDVPETFWSGFPRVGASYFIGVAIFHLQVRIPDWRGWTPAFWALAAIMAAVFYTPFVLPLPIQLVWVAILAPLLVLAGSRVRLPDGIKRLCVFGGALSYPIYCLHYPVFTWTNGLYRTRFGARNIAVEVPLIVVVVLAVSFLALKFYDEPCRRFLATGLDRVQRARPAGPRHARQP